MKKQFEKKNLFEEITNKFLDALKAGQSPIKWIKPWIAGTESQIVSHSTGKGYSLLNTMLICMSGVEAGEFATFNQIKAEGGHVKKGATATPIYFWKMLEVEKKDENGKAVVKDGKVLKSLIPLLKYYNVFNILTDVEGIEPKFLKKEEKKEKKKVNPIKKAEEVAKKYLSKFKIKFTNADIDKACYYPSKDSVQVPPIQDFKHKEEYYSTLFHELTHSTGHESRLDRIKSTSFGSWHYAKEELVAEIGAACSLNTLGIDTEKSFSNSTAYIQSWIKILGDDPKAIVVAAGKAEKAVNMIFGKEQKQEKQEA